MPKFKLKKGFWTLNGKKLKDCNLGEQILFDAFFKSVKINY